MTSENGNGELKQLLEIKRAYRRDLTSAEQDLKAKFDQELADAKKRLKEKYLENVVDTVFAEAQPVTVELEATEATIAVKPEVKLDFKVSAPSRCPDCEAKVEPAYKFCPQCAAPLKEEEAKPAESEVVVSTSSKPRPRRRP